VRHDTDIEGLKLLAEQLELTRTLLSSDSPIEAKVAIILLDSLADSMMYRHCCRTFGDDSYIAVIRRPKFSQSIRREALRDFKTKVNLLCTEKFLTPEDAVVFKIGHSYRNAAYHRDIHNPQVTHEIGRLLFMSVCNLVESYYKNGVSSGGFEPQPWLANYGLRTDFINFEQAARTIVAKLVLDVSIPLESARAAFQDDLDSRLMKLQKRIDELPTSDNSAVVDEGLKLAEFADEHPEEQFSRAVWEMNYKIAGGDGDKVNHKQYKAAESKAKRLRNKALSSFTPKCSLRVFKHLRSATSVKSAKSIPAVMSAYQNLDSQLSLFESSVEKLGNAIDWAIQAAIDIERGK
jgi:hypothetical protein